MAEEQVASQRLVLDGLPEKLQKMQLNNLMAKQQEKLSKNKNEFFRLFRKLSYRFFGLSQLQLQRDFSASELKELDRLISRKARPWAIFQILFALGVPIVGWLIGICECLEDSSIFNSWRYLHHRKCLLRAYREEGFLSIFLEIKGYHNG